MMQMRHRGFKVLVDQMCEFLRTGRRMDRRGGRVDAQLLAVTLDGLGRIVRLDERHGAIAPGLVRCSEHVSLVHAGDVQQHLADLGRIDVLAARDDQVLGAREHPQKTASIERGAITRHEEAVGTHRLARVQVSRKDARPGQAQLADAPFIGAHDACLIPGQQAQTPIEAARHGRGGHQARRLGHAVARVHRRLRAQRRADRVVVQRRAAQQDAGVLADHTVVVGLQEVGQHLVHDRDVRHLEAQHVVQDARRVEPLVEDERRSG